MLPAHPLQGLGSHLCAASSPARGEKDAAPSPTAAPPVGISSPVRADHPLQGEERDRSHPGEMRALPPLPRHTSAHSLPQGMRAV